MAHITTSYKADMAELTGVRSEEYDADTVKDVLKAINARHGKAAYKHAKTLLITINSLSIQKQHYLSSKLSDGDVVGFFPLSAGG